MTRDPQKVLQHQQRERALELGRGSDPLAVRELAVLLESPFPDVRRLAASAMGKLAPFLPSGPMVVAALRTPALYDSHPQVRQYALKAIAKYPETAAHFLEEFRDVGRNGSLPSYVRTAAAEVVAAVENFLRERDASKTNRCRRCSRVVSNEEFIRSMDRFARPYCTHCFDEILLEGANFEATVEGAKEKMAVDGTAVQSGGEKRIADWLAAHQIAFVYDERYLVARDTLIRPDFYLPEFDLYIEYWGMDNPEYNANRQKKLWLYQRAGKKLISLSFHDITDLENVLSLKLSRYIRL